MAYPEGANRACRAILMQDIFFKDLGPPKALGVKTARLDFFFFIVVVAINPSCSRYCE